MKVQKFHDGLYSRAETQVLDEIILSIKIIRI